MLFDIETVELTIVQPRISHFSTWDISAEELHQWAEQEFEPKSATKRLEDGTLYSPPLEDLYPFLPREELKGNMYIKIVE